MARRNNDYQPRAYQQEIINLIREEVRKSNKTIMCLPTGAGKTKTTVYGIVVKAVHNSKRVLCIAHRSELIKQMDGDLRAAGLETGIIQGNVKPNPSAPVQVASISTLARRLDQLPEADIVIIDECHHVRSATYMVVVAHYKAAGAIIVGLTATPERLDGKGLGDVFDSICETVTVRELIDSKHLADYDYYAPSMPNLDGVRKFGDFHKRGASDAMNKRVITGSAVSHYRKYLNGKRALVFAAGISHSLAVVEQFKAAGIAAEHLDGTDTATRREQVLADLESGKVKVVSNVDLFDEGFDCPSVQGAIILRPTMSFVKHRQMLGRALRVKEDGSKAILLDHAGNWMRHGMPDDIVEWDLEDKAEKKPSAPKHKQCPACFAVVKVHEKQCPQCGYKFIGKPRTGPEFKDGDLKKVKAKRWTMEEKEGLYRAIMEKARVKGYRPGWAARKYRREVKVWPRGFVQKVQDELFPKCMHIQIDEGTERCKFCGEYCGEDYDE